MNQSRSLKTRHATLALILGVSAAASAQSPAVAPRWGRPTPPVSGACFYRDIDFRGDYFCALPGQDISYLPRGMNQQISSIRAFGDTEVTIFQDQRFAGRWTRLQADVPDLRGEGWNGRLSSIHVNSEYRAYHGRYARRSNGSGLGTIETQPWQDDHTNRPVAPNGSGAAGGQANYARREAANAVVRRAYQDLLQREPEPQGQTLFRNHILYDGWTEQEVRDAMMKSSEYRERVAPTPQQNAEQIVARAYRSVLGREPDPASSGYVDKVLRQQWTEADVSRELRKSPEYRSKHPAGSRP